MNYGKRRRKSNIGKTILFLVLAVMFASSAGILAYKVPADVKTLKESKATLSNVEKEHLEVKESLKSYEVEIGKIEEQLAETEKKLQEAQAANPDLQVENSDSSKKYAYLTFDDGPSENTVKILDFLKANNIKATFFVLGKENEDDVYKRIVEEGHTLAVHSDTHQYQDIYASVNNFMADVNTLADKLEAITGVRPSISRFPGGSNNTIGKKYGGTDIMDKIIPEITKAGFIYFDWNVDSLDASKNKQDKDVIVNSVLQGSRGKEHAVILMHDAAPKTTTVEALPQIVEGLREQGFTFKAITDDTPQIKFK